MRKWTETERLCVPGENSEIKWRGWICQGKIVRSIGEVREVGYDRKNSAIKSRDQRGCIFQVEILRYECVFF